MKKRDRQNFKISIISIVISIAAILVSAAAIYFSVFYKSHDLRVSVVGCTKNNFTEEFSIDIHLNNAGNTYVTILSTDIVFSWGDRSNYFDFDSLGDPKYDLVYKPLILKPGEQTSKTILAVHKFENRNYIRNVGHFKLKSNYRNYYSVDLLISFVSSDGNLANEQINIGRLFFSDKGNVEELAIDYRSKRVQLDTKSFSTLGVRISRVREDSVWTTQRDKLLWDSLFKAFKKDTLTASHVYSEILFKRRLEKLQRSSETLK